MRRFLQRNAPLGCALGVALAATVARADPPAPAAAPVVVLPTVAERAPVPYPDGAKGDAEVVLLLTIDKSGAVSRAEVESGPEPFASTASSEALGWRFHPATRDGAPFSAKIKFLVAFTAPAPPPSPPPSPSPSPSPPPSPSPSPSLPPSPSPAPKPRPLEVDIHEDKPPPSVSSLARTEVRQLPGAFGDPFRAIEILPGVTPVVSGLPYFYVRGAPPGNVGYFLDGVRVPYLFHVAVGPSIVNPAMVDRVDLFSGGYPARFGRFAGAIVSAETTAPRDDWHGEGNLRLFDAGAMVEGGFDGGRGTVLLGGRYSYTAALLSAISPGVKLDYRDVQARATYDLGPRDRIGVFAFGAYDLLSQVENGIESIVFGSEFYRVDVRYDHKLDGSGTMRAAATLGFDQTRVGEQRNARDTSFATRLEIDKPIDDAVTVRGGLDAQFDGYKADATRWADPEDPSIKGFDALFPPRTDAAFGAWADVVWWLDPRLQVVPGLRGDVFRSAGASAASIDPRLAIRADVTDKVHLLHAFGVAHQPPSFVVPLPGMAIGNLANGLQTSLQESAGVELDLPWGTTATVTGFDDVFLNMSDTLGAGTPPRDVATREPRSLGSSYGLEVYVRKRLTSKLGGFVSYTLSRSTRRFGRDTFPSAFDRTHVLNLAAAYDLGRNWRAGARFTFYTGAPTTTNPDGTRVVNEDPAHPQRDPAFYRIDLRVEKRWNLGKSRWLSFVVEMLNATLHKETIRGQAIGPIAIPSLGLEGGF
jgi:hypothetical protein